MLSPPRGVKVERFIKEKPLFDIVENLLRKIGLTEGEIKVYKALLKLKSSSTGLIVKESRISASKVYVILDKLIEKGLVSFVVENNIKIFTMTNPENILEYVDKKQKEMEKVKKESESIIRDMKKSLRNYVAESAQIYRGYAGLRVAFRNIIGELDKKNDFLFFSVTGDEFDEKTIKFFNEIHDKRVERKINSKGIIDIDLRYELKKFAKQRRSYKIKFYELTLPSALSIGKTRVVFTLLGKNPIAFEIISKRIAQRYRNYFNRLWDSIKS